MDMAYPKWTTPQPDCLHSCEEALPTRSEYCQNTKFSRSRHWKWSGLADDDLPPSSGKKKKKPKHTRLKFDREKLEDPNVLENFQAMIGGKLSPLSIISNEDTDTDSMITTFNTAVTETASEILGKHCQKKKTWITAEILDLCDRRRACDSRNQKCRIQGYR